MEETQKILDSKNSGEQLLKHYQGEGCRYINELFRTNENLLSKEEKGIKTQIEIKLNHFLKTSTGIKKYSNKTIFREDSDFNTDWFINNKNKVICFPSYLSTYRSTEQCQGRDVVNIRTLPKNSNAYDIFGFNVQNPEKEILIIPNTNFRITFLRNILFLKETKSPTEILLEKDSEFYFKKQIGKKSLSDLNII